MIYYLELNDLPFNAIKSGKKKIETRTITLNNQTPYREMQKGDQIIFTKTSGGEKMTAEILGVRHYDNIAEMFDSEGQENCMSYDCTKEEAIKSYDSLTGYTDGIKKHGIYAIEVKPLN